MLGIWPRGAALLLAVCAGCTAAESVQAQMRANAVPAMLPPPEYLLSPETLASDPFVPEAIAQQAFVQDTVASTGRLVSGGVMGASLGLLIGGAVGGGLETTLSKNCIDYCGLGGALLGAAVGESLGMAFGVHAANHRRGSFAGAVVGPLAVGLGALALGIVLEDINVPPLLVMVGVPVGQLYTSIRGERAAARRRSAPPD